MKRLILICSLCLFYLTACTNSSGHSHNEETHTHETDDHSHDDGHGHAHDHSHDHEQEEFAVESDTLKQDSLKSQQK